MTLEHSNQSLPDGYGKVIKMMTPLIKQLLLEVLEQHADNQGRSGCNDYDITRFTPDERAELIRLYNQAGKLGNPEHIEVGPDATVVTDFILTYALEFAVEGMCPT